MAARKLELRALLSRGTACLGYFFRHIVRACSGLLLNAQQSSRCGGILKQGQHVELCVVTAESQLPRGQTVPKSPLLEERRWCRLRPAVEGCRRNSMPLS